MNNMLMIENYINIKPTRGSSPLLNKRKLNHTCNVAAAAAAGSIY
jgi:hypothetical protein